MAGGSLPSTNGDEDTSESAGILSEINITPLVDVMLVLLIIFMVTSSVMVQQGIGVDLPKATQSSSSSAPEGVIVSLLPEGQIKVNTQTFSAQQEQEIEAAIREAFKSTSSKLVILEGDRKAFLGNAVTIMDRARRAGAERFAIATAPEK